MANHFIGRWSYRSLANNPDLSVSFEDLRFGAGTLELTEPETGKVGGSRSGPGWSLSLDGTVTDGDTTILGFQGRGVIGARNGFMTIMDF